MVPSGTIMVDNASWTKNGIKFKIPYVEATHPEIIHMFHEYLRGVKQQLNVSRL